jgi:hypothetical protein
MAKLVLSTAGAAVLWAGGIAVNAGFARFSNERVAGADLPLLAQPWRAEARAARAAAQR